MNLTTPAAMIFSKPASPMNSTDQQPLTPLVSYHVYTIFMFVFGITATNIVALFGIVSNVANIIVYYKMGLSETTNISFFTLAVNDVVVCLAFIVVEICHSPFMRINELPPGSFALQCSYMASFVAYLCCGFGAFITAVLSTERCLCIALPLKVRSIITSRRLSGVIIGLAIWQLTFFVANLVRTGPPYDRSVPERGIYLLCFYTFPTLFCFPVISISTAFLIFRLKQTRNWRETVTQQTNSDAMKEKKISRSVIVICSMFIICFFPNMINVSLTTLHGQFKLHDPFLKWLVHAFYVVTYFFQTLNSSVNIFIYYNMSTRYRAVFVNVFLSKENQQS